MSDEHASFERYAEALAAIAEVDGRRKKALEGAARDEQSAREEADRRRADQQAMFDRVGADCAESEAAISRLCGSLRMQEPNSHASIQSRSRPLAELRAELVSIANWLSDAESRTESLLRTRRRLDNQKAAPPAAAPPPPVEVENSDSQLRVIAGALAAAVLLILVLVLISR